ncbi:hypothetical protein ESZ53_01355 [Salinibacterium sp. UTAS2018]|uniref:hypothetical protein n=1 Tax=Salinibacterium sp. UTAS2018 TaxID=2508880 RepID=UPI00100979B9|nr:hypothetical protein [Salinibacterium sp. UTAS2018]QAV69205.1 hypothetical protein ESZ53_01355 [Salinibacterium sp. UTAS2018]
MPTFYDPGADAGEASGAPRGLAHATRTFESPQDLYAVLGDLLSGVRSLKQVLDQLAAAHIENRPRAFDDHGDHAIGSKDALAAAAELHQAATLIDQAEERLDAAAGAASRVVWREVPASEAPTVARWINVVFMQGQEADAVLNMIDADGALAGLDHLKRWDFGDETTSAAMENGYVYDVPPSGPLERELHDDDYHLVYSHAFAHVALYRIHTVDTVDQLPDDVRSFSARSAPSRTHGAQRASWFEPASITAVKRQRGLGI